MITSVWWLRIIHITSAQDYSKVPREVKQNFSFPLIIKPLTMYSSANTKKYMKNITKMQKCLSSVHSHTRQATQQQYYSTLKQLFCTTHSVCHTTQFVLCGKSEEKKFWWFSMQFTLSLKFSHCVVLFC